VIEDLRKIRNGNHIEAIEIAMEVTPHRCSCPLLDSVRQKGNLRFVPQRLSLSNPNCRVGFGTMLAALTALSLAVLGHFF
jgi:hypothetical protein